MNARSEAEARRHMRIDRDKDLPESRAMYTVVCPTGWCFEPGRHTYVAQTRALAKEAKATEAIARCAVDCDCLVEDDEVPDVFADLFEEVELEKLEEQANTLCANCHHPRRWHVSGCRGTFLRAGTRCDCSCPGFKEPS